MLCLRLCFVFTIAILLLFGRADAQPIAASAKVTRFVTKPGIHSWCFDPQNNRAFASHSLSGTVYEFNPSTGAQIREFKVGQLARELVIKNNKLVVACHEDTTLWIVDLDTNEVATSFKLDGQFPRALCTSQANNSFVYVVTSESTSTLHQIDVNKAQIANSRKLSTRFATLTLALDGSHACLNRRYIYQFFDDLALLRFHSTAKSRVRKDGVASWDAINSEWFIGSTRYDSTGLTAGRAYQGFMTVPHPSADLVASLVIPDFPKNRPKTIEGLSLPAKLVFQELESAKQLASVNLPTLMLSSEIYRLVAANNNLTVSAPQHLSADPIMVFDSKLGQVFIGSSDTGYVIQLDAVGLSPEERFALIAPSRVEATPGQNVRIKLKSSGSGTLRSMFVGKVEDIALADNELSWTPTADDIGTRSIEIEGTSGTKKASATIEIAVTFPSVQLGFEIDGLHMNSTGTKAVCWGRAPSKRFGLALVDLRKRAVLASQLFNEGLSRAWLIGDRVYTQQQSSVRIKQLESSSLETIKEFKSPSRESDLGGLPDGTLVVAGRHTSQMFDSISLEPVSERSDRFYSINTGGMTSRDIQAVETLWSGCTRIGGAVYDSKRRLLVHVTQPDLPSIPPSSRTRLTREFGFTAWGLPVGSNGFNFARSSFQSHRNPIAISDKYPVALTIARTSSSNPPTLEVRELIKGDPLKKMPLDSLGDRNYSGKFCIDTNADMFAFTYRSRIYTMDLPQIAKRRRMTPLAISFPRIPVLDVEKRLVIQPSCTGGSGPYRFSYGIADQRTMRDVTKGAMEFDLPQLWSQFVDSPESQRQLRELDQHASSFKHLTGKELPVGRFPVSVNFNVQATDAKGLSSRVSFFVIATGPLADMKTSN